MSIYTVWFSAGHIEIHYVARFGARVHDDNDDGVKFEKK